MDLGVAFQTHPGRQAFISSGSKEARYSIFLFVRVCHDNGKFSESPFAAGAFVRIHLLFAPI